MQVGVAHEALATHGMGGNPSGKRIVTERSGPGIGAAPSTFATSEVGRAPHRQRVVSGSLEVFMALITLATLIMDRLFRKKRSGSE